MNMLIKFIALAAISATALSGQIEPNASIVSEGTPFDGGGHSAAESVTVVLDAAADAGIAWTENTMWRPDGTPEVLGNLDLGSHPYTPSGGAGLYSLQFRVVDSNQNYQDQWVTFTVQPGYLNAEAAVDAAGPGYLLTEGGEASNGVAWTENVIWRPDGGADDLGRAGLGQLFYTPSAGSGLYWYQYRLVDNAVNFRDEWISFVVP